ncbi:hypothetical protein [Bradyrhizobium sp. BRP56]|uniref:hypothetical protein n=1 Tax=Bradyrhizobium sp. BRP56 TaxID=2793819 RepID=UPI001CD54042|nr:hypothetical protein [Bradyrhizobium sp. BRP56]MCA1396354.1 hypothetical protein [Bradyrhizobium sp. BRP56]
MNDAAAFATKCLQLLQYLATHKPDSAAARRLLMGPAAKAAVIGSSAIRRVSDS